MGFNSVYKCLQEIFPKVDSRLLRAVAIENSKDADQAVDVVLKEILPYFSSESNGPVNPPEDNEVETEDQVDLLRQQQVVDKADEGPSSEPRPITIEDAKVTEDIGGVVHADSTPLVEDFFDANDGNDHSCGNSENEEVILIGIAQENSVKVGLNEKVHATSNAMLDGGNDDQKQICENTESEEVISWGTCNENNIKVGSDSPGVTASLINEKDGVRGIVNDLDYDAKGLDFSVADDLDMVICGKSDKEESCSDSTEVRNSVIQRDTPSVKENASVSSECGVQTEFGSEPSVTECQTQAANGSSDVAFNLEDFVSEMSDIEDEPTMDTVVTRSGQVCNFDLLEEIIEDAKNNKVLFMCF
jgi:hypothetical protein